MSWDLLLWAAALLIVYTYVGYPALLGLLTWRRRHPEYAPWDDLPSVSLILAAVNESRVIRAKIDNTLALDYPSDKLQFIVVSDGSSDGTDDIVAEYADRGVALHRLETRSGKTLAQNAGVRLASGEVLVFTDANSLFLPDALQALVRPFTDARVGCVCGELRYTNPEQLGAGKGEDVYWTYEQGLKRRESLLSSTLGANGSIYAVRRACFEELGPEIISDFIMPIRVWRQGFRAVYEPRAVATEDSAISFGDEFRRRARIIARSMYGLWCERGVLSPMRHGLFAFQMISHKVLRWLVPVFLTAVLAASVPLAQQHRPYLILLALQIAFYAIATLGLLAPGRLGRLAVFYVPAYFCAINLGAMLGLMSFLTGRRYQVWQPVTRL